MSLIESNQQLGVREIEEDEIDLLNLIMAFWATRYAVFAALMAVILIFAGYLFIKTTYLDTPTYEQLISFTFEGVDNSSYPNGDRFRISDIIAPAVIQEVHESLFADVPAVSLQELISAVNIQPYVPTREFIIKKYRAVLDDKLAELADKEQARAKMAEELAQVQRQSASLSLSDNHRNIPEQLALATIEMIPKVWARQAIDIRGVTKFDIVVLDTSVLDRVFTIHQDRLYQLKSIWDYLNVIKSQVKSLADSTRSRSVTDKETGFKAFDLSTMIENTERTIIELPSYWSKEISDQLRLNIALYSPRMFDPKLLEDLDYLIAVELLSERIGMVSGNVDKLAVNEFGNLVTDPVTGYTLLDLRRLLTDMDGYDVELLRAPLIELGISKDPDKVSLYYNFRINELERQKKALEDKSNNIMEAETRYFSGSSVAGTIEPDQKAAPTTTIIPQLGDAFLDRLIALSDKGGDNEYRQALTNKNISIKESSIELQQRITRLKDYLALFNAAVDSTNKASKEGKKPASKSAGKGTDFTRAIEAQREEYLEKLELALPEILLRLKTYAEVTERISTRLRYAKELISIFDESKFKPLSFDIYLQDTNEKAPPLSLIVEELKFFTQVTNRIVNQIGKDRLGATDDLFVFAADAKRSNKIVNKREVVVLVLSLVLVGFFTMLGKMLVNSIRKRSAQNT